MLESMGLLAAQKEVHARVKNKSRVGGAGRGGCGVVVI